MATPIFSDSGDSQHESNPPKQDMVPGAVETVSLDVGGEPLEVVNFHSTLPIPTTAKDRSTFVRAAEAVGLLDEDGQHAMARALVRPEAAAPLIKNGLLVTETVEKATLSQVPGHVWTTELWPLLQPRTEAESLTVSRPKVRGTLDSAGNPLAELALTFKDVQHLADYMHQTIVHTRRTGNDYAPSILARRVGRPVLAHAVRLEFEDGSQPFQVLAVRDGLTRLVCAIAARLGDNATPDEIAARMISDLLATAPPRAGKAPDASQDHARGRERVANELRARFTAGVATGSPTEEAVRIGQTFTLPAQIYVEVKATPTAMLPADEVFAEAIRAVVGSIHTEFRSWDTAAQAIDVGERALVRAQHTGHLEQDVVKLATGVLGPEYTSRVFGDNTIPNTALWRAIYLISTVSQPKAYEALKNQLRSLLGMTKIHNKRFAGYLGPLVDIPWRSTKGRSLQPARRAWSSGGPIPFTLFGTDWEPVPTDDFLSLVPRSLDGDANARRTLQVAGGVALVADRLLASNIGSALHSGTVPFRAEPNDIIAKLSAPDNVVGLYQLAYAAKMFRSDQPAVNSFSERDFRDQGNLPADIYTVPSVDPADPSQVLLDAAGQPRPLTQFEVVRISDPVRAAQAVAEAGVESQEGYTMPQSPEAQAKTLRQKLRTDLEIVDDTLSSLLGLAGGGSVLGTWGDWSEISTRAQKISSQITVHEPPEEDDHHSSETDNDYDDELTED
ncbi:hypothetical protein AB0L57_19885 [Nocardia sp. NPDC052254]|uniref:hypothetical protein n=1 Tax=Nocardia sp. NPDC052254 TaxID=3155681 RepID=UPI0034214D89